MREAKRGEREREKSRWRPMGRSHVGFGESCRDGWKDTYADGKLCAIRKIDDKAVD